MKIVKWYSAEWDAHTVNTENNLERADSCLYLPCTLRKIFIEYKDVWIYPYYLNVSLPDCHVQFKWQCDADPLYLYICTYIPLFHFSNICNSFKLISMHCLHNFTAWHSPVRTEPLPQVLLKVHRSILLCGPEHLYYCHSSASHPNSAKQQESSSQFPC